MRVLWVSPFLPAPDRGGGYLHAWELLARMGRKHAVTLLCLELDPRQQASSQVELGVEVLGVEQRRHVASSRAALLWGALRGPGSEHFRWLLPGVEAAGQELTAVQDRYDLAFIWGSELAPLLSYSSLPTAYYVTDAHTTYHRRLMRAAPTRRHRLLYALDALHVHRWERTRYRIATALATTSLMEATVLGELTGRQFDVIPVALGDDWFASPQFHRERNLLSIIAGLDYWPNIDGIRWFLTRCWPRIRSALPEVRLRVVGRSPSPELRAAIASADAELVADVPDVRPYYWQASVAVIPLRVGSGVKNKLIHAFACGAPVVATPVAIEGTAATAGTHLLIGRDAEALAEAVCEALSHPAEAERRAEIARALADPYRAERTAAALEEFWQRATVAVSPSARKTPALQPR